MFFATIFFVLGAAFCYLVVFPVGYRFFLAEYATIGVSPSIRISEYLSFTSRMLLAFGMTFELPVITFFLARLGIVTHQMMLRYSATRSWSSSSSRRCSRPDPTSPRRC